MDDFDLAPPPFRPESALARLDRELRALGLAPREGHYERRGLRLVRAAVDGETLRVARVRRPVRSSPEWQERLITGHAALRDFVADVARALSSWNTADD